MKARPCCMICNMVGLFVSDAWLPSPPLKPTRSRAPRRGSGAGAARERGGGGARWQPAGRVKMLARVPSKCGRVPKRAPSKCGRECRQKAGPQSRQSRASVPNKARGGPAPPDRHGATRRPGHEQAELKSPRARPKRAIPARPAAAPRVPRQRARPPRAQDNNRKRMRDDRAKRGAGAGGDGLFAVYGMRRF